jgi:copper oxidase (laccase) domain-containing protein
MRGEGADDIGAALGPCIRAGCYEFGESDLSAMESAFGPRVRATTTWGTAAFDLAAAVGVALENEGVALVVDAAACTACSESWFSHRARSESSRQATVIWLPEPGPDSAWPGR